MSVTIEEVAELSSDEAIRRLGDVREKLRELVWSLQYSDEDQMENLEALLEELQLLAMWIGAANALPKFTELLEAAAHGN